MFNGILLLLHTYTNSFYLHNTSMELHVSTQRVAIQRTWNPLVAAAVHSHQLCAVYLQTPGSTYVYLEIWRNVLYVWGLMICMTFMCVNKPRYNTKHSNFLRPKALASNVYILARVTLLLPFDTPITNIEDNPSMYSGKKPRPSHGRQSFLEWIISVMSI